MRVYHFEMKYILTTKTGISLQMRNYLLQNVKIGQYFFEPVKYLGKAGI